MSTTDRILTGSEAFTGFLLGIVLVFLVAVGFADIDKASNPKERATRYQIGCGLCCCNVRTPKGTKPRNTIKYCERAGDKVCVKMCRKALKNR